MASFGSGMLFLVILLKAALHGGVKHLCRVFTARAKARGYKIQEKW